MNVSLENEFSKVNIKINFVSTYQQQIFKNAIYKSPKQIIQYLEVNLTKDEQDFLMEN